jgi:hypothetical protein
MNGCRHSRESAYRRTTMGVSMIERQPAVKEFFLGKSAIRGQRLTGNRLAS